jgi:ankyrin repeat protein
MKDEYSPPIAWAARCNRLSMVNYLYKKGANINIKFSYIGNVNTYHSNTTPRFWADKF